MTLQRLQAALKALEQGLPPMALALHRATPEVRTAYRQYRADCREWCAHYPGGLAYQVWINGEAEPPPVPPALLHILPAAPVFRVGDDAAALWRTFLEGE